jgi:hypothetical protein
MTPPWLTAIGGFVVRVLGKAGDSTGSKIATANVAKRLAEKAGLGEIADIASATQGHHQRRMDAQTASMEADVAAKMAQAFKVMMEGIEMANRLAADPNSIPTARAVALRRLDVALASLGMHGGGMLVDSRKLDQIANPSARAALPPVTSDDGKIVSATLGVATESEKDISKSATISVDGVVAAPGTGQLEITGHAPAVVAGETGRSMSSSALADLDAAGQPSGPQVARPSAAPFGATIVGPSHPMKHMELDGSLLDEEPI